MPVCAAGLESALYTRGVQRERQEERPKVRASQVRKATAADPHRGLKAAPRTLLMPCSRGQVRVLPLPLGQLFEGTGH